MIGSALIVIALLLTCGPLRDWFGGAGGGGETIPPVAAGPPDDAAGTLGAAAAGAVAGAQLGDSDIAGMAAEEVSVDADAGSGVDAADVAAGAAVAGAAAAGSAAASSGGGAATSASSAPVLPPVSAGVPDTEVASAGVESPAALAAAAAASVFDDSFEGADAVSGAGPIVARFAPPVAAVGGSPLALSAASQPFGIQEGGVRQPCDSPGAGCQNILVISNPPLIPGVRPIPTPAIANPPLIPGQRPVPPQS